MTRERQHDLI